MTPRHRAMLVAVISTIAVVAVLGVWPVAVGRFGPAGLFVPAIAAVGVVLASHGYPAGISAAAVLLGAQYGVSLHGVPGVDAAAVFEAVGLALLVGCGGWSFRQTIFGGDAHADREPALLDPKGEPARIRAFFVRPDWARRGIGRALLEHCEAEARRHGFRSATLVATLPGERFYRAFGYGNGESLDHRLPRGLTIRFVSLSKALSSGVETT